MTSRQKRTESISRRLSFLSIAIIASFPILSGCSPDATIAGSPELTEADKPAESTAKKAPSSPPKSITTTSKLSKMNIKFNELTEKEAAVILHKGTERPWIGELTDNKRKGTYICRRCNAPLYKSESKFDSHCGWPSFDDEIPHAVQRLPDADGHRTEIVCKNCEGHLGHVFLNEGYTAKNTRHCVNSISMKFIPEGQELPSVIRADSDQEDTKVAPVKKESKTPPKE